MQRQAQSTNPKIKNHNMKERIPSLDNFIKESKVNEDWKYIELKDDKYIKYFAEPGITTFAKDYANFILKGKALPDKYVKSTSNQDPNIEKYIYREKDIDIRVEKKKTVFII